MDEVSGEALTILEEIMEEVFETLAALGDFAELAAMVDELGGSQVAELAFGGQLDRKSRSVGGSEADKLDLLGKARQMVLITDAQVDPAGGNKLNCTSSIDASNPTTSLADISKVCSTDVTAAGTVPSITEHNAKKQL